jgi:septal ring factor EnvC (AmiA/AmiB activator)
MAASPMRGKYDTLIDRESAWEKLRARADAAAAEAAKTETAASDAREFERAHRYDGKAEAESKPRRTSSSRSDSVGEVFAKSFARQLGSKSGQAMLRGVLGSLFGKR